MAYLILTAVGPDRPGLVDEVSEVLSERRLNIETSRMALLGGEFAMILMASGEESAVRGLVDDPSPLAEVTGLELFVKPTSPPEGASLPASVPFQIVTAGMDHPGIVHDVASVLHRFEVSIETLDTRVVRAPHSGTPVFNMEAVVAVPVAVRVKELRGALEALGDELNMDIELMPAEGV